MNESKADQLVKVEKYINELRGGIWSLRWILRVIERMDDSIDEEVTNLIKESIARKESEILIYKTKRDDLIKAINNNRY